SRPITAALWLPSGSASRWTRRPGRSNSRAATTAPSSAESIASASRVSPSTDQLARICGSQSGASQYPRRAWRSGAGSTAAEGRFNKASRPGTEARFTASSRQDRSPYTSAAAVQEQSPRPASPGMWTCRYTRRHPRESSAMPSITLPFRPRLLACAAVLLSLSTPALAQRVVQGDLQQQMSPAEFKAAGLDKLNAAELATLNRWLQGKVEAATTEAVAAV